MGLLSLSLVSQKLVVVRFPQLHGTNTYRRVVSLGLETQTIFDTDLLSLSLDSQKLGGMFPSASRHQQVEKSRFTRA